MFRNQREINVKDDDMLMNKPYIYIYIVSVYIYIYVYMCLIIKLSYGMQIYDSLTCASKIC